MMSDERPKRVVRLKMLSSPTKPSTIKSVIRVPTPSDDNTIVFEMSPREKTPVEKTPLDKTPVDKTPVEKTPVDSETPGDKLKRTSHGRVSYNRQHTLSEDELPGRPHIVRGGYFKVLHRMCNEAARQRSSSSDVESNGVSPARCPAIQKSPVVTASVVETVVENSHLVIEESFNINESITQLEDKENLVDSMAMLDLERKKKLFALSQVESKREQHYEVYRKSAEQSIESYEKFCEGARQRWEGQVAELNKRNDQKSMTIESDYVKLQRLYQTQYEEGKAIIKKVEESEKRRSLEETRNKEKVNLSLINILKQDKLITDAIIGVKQSVESRMSVQEVSNIIQNMIISLAQVNNIKTDASQLYGVGELGPQTVVKFEVEMTQQYQMVLGQIDELNRVVSILDTVEAEKQVKVQMEAATPPPTQPATDPAPQLVTNLAHQPVAEPPPQPTPQPSTTEACVKATIVSQTAYKQYELLCKQLKTVQDSIDKFVKSSEVAKMRSALKMVTVTPINSISASSNQHMASKVHDLSDVLGGKPVTRNGKTITPGFNQLTLNYCFDVAAAKFVEQGCEQVAFSDNLIPAFSIAAVLTGLWQNHPKFGEFYLAHLQQRCPYAVPVHWPRKSNEDNTTYLKRLGYAMDGDGVEGKEKFLQRMEGCIKLYAAVIQSPSSDITKPHPHGLEHGWLWLSRVLNLDPIPEVTATILEAFLKVAAHQLHLKYKSQFLKLLDCLYRQYLPKLEDITDPKNMGPITRLKLYLEAIKMSGTIPKPAGRIEDSICREGWC